MFSRNLYKNGVRVCNLRKECNTLIKLLEFFPDEKFCYSWSPAVDPPITHEHFIYPMYGTKWGINYNPNLTQEYLQNDFAKFRASNPPKIAERKFCEKWGDCRAFWANPSIVTRDDFKGSEVVSFLPRTGIDHIIFNPNITPEFFQKCLKWDISRYVWEYVCMVNPAISWKTARDNPDLFGPTEISQCHDVTQAVIENNPDIDWNWFYLCINPHMTGEYICKNIDRVLSTMDGFSYYYLGTNRALTRETALKLLSLIPETSRDHFVSGLSTNPSVSTGSGERGPWGMSSDNPNLTWEHFKNGRGGCGGLSFTYHPNITIKNLLSVGGMLDSVMMKNPNLTLKDFLVYPFQKYLAGNRYFSSNKFLYSDIVYGRLLRNKGELREYIADFRWAVREFERRKTIESTSVHEQQNVQP